MIIQPKIKKKILCKKALSLSKCFAKTYFADGCNLYLMSNLPEKDKKYADSYIIVGSEIFWITSDGDAYDCECAKKTTNFLEGTGINQSNGEKPTRLNEAQRALLEKNITSNGGHILASSGKKLGRLVVEHCLIVGEVARSLVKRMPAWLCEALFPKGAELIAAVHDVGKISPTFQEKIYRGIDGCEKNSIPELANADPDLEKGWGGHAGVSQAAVNDKDLKTGKYIPEIVGQHHGYSTDLNGKIASAEVFGGDAWQNERKKAIVELKTALEADWPKIKDSLQARVLAGLTTVADWIGSGPLFENPEESWRPLIQTALDESGFVQPKLRQRLTFTDIFDFVPRDVQQKLIEHAVLQPGVYIIEAPMGSGKTEAALYAAYKVMAAGKATGFYFALPTQLTSDKIHSRVNNFLQKILMPEYPHRKALLTHGLAWLKNTELGEDGQPGSSWFHARKRGILAPFGVGTIDQALMAVMNVKHGFVRTFGLAGKVVILDEVHSYDVYTGTILDQLIKGLRELHCTVIILSATLTQERRSQLLGAASVKQNYPLISFLPNNSSSLTEVAVKPLANVEVHIHLCCNNDNASINEVLLRAEQGQQILWIENTVAEAQEKYKLLAAKADDINLCCGLLHSRFIKVDRECNEEYWVSLYGKDNNDERQKQGRILVGTQVLEQSLDIDADFLITRMCPTDMLLQRLGRLWRHENTVRPKEAKREAWILAPRLEEAVGNLEKSFGKTANIYSPYVLYRSLKIWYDLRSVILPKDIRCLIEATYIEHNETNDVVICAKEKLKNRCGTLKKLALVGLSVGGKTLPENKAGTRYSEQDSIEVLLFSSYGYNSDKSGTYITLLNGKEIYLPRNRKTLNKQRWRDIAAVLTENTVRVAEYLAPKAVPVKDLQWLRDYLYLGNKKENSLLRVAIVQASGELLALDGGTVSENYAICYDKRLGYSAEKL